MSDHRWKPDDTGTTFDGERWRVIAVNVDGRLTAEHEPTGEVETMMPGLLEPDRVLDQPLPDAGDDHA